MRDWTEYFISTDCSLADRVPEQVRVVLALLPGKSVEVVKCKIMG